MICARTRLGIALLRSVSRYRVLQQASCSRCGKEFRLSSQQRRCLSIHEHHSQQILKDFGVPVPRGQLVRSPEEARNVVSSIGGRCVLKSQILAGGRGKGTFDNGLQGGIQVVNSPNEAQVVSKSMLGHCLKTKQTKDVGFLVDKLYVAESIKYAEEYYLAMTIDRARYSPVIILSRQGGVDIETTAKERPEELLKFWFTLSEGITPQLMEEICQNMGCSPAEGQHLQDILEKMYKIFRAKDATMLEINPLVRTQAGKFVCLDAKFSFDNAASKRQKELFALRDRSQETAEELEAEQYGLVYVPLEGDIGNIVNGAGLAMATNDAISLYGGSSANFLDAGGQATKETMQKAFEIIMRDSRVKVILVNIYGGIIRCDMIAESIIAAAAELGGLKIPVVVRLQGTNSELGLDLVSKSGLGLHTESEFGEAAKKAVELARAA